MSKLTIAFYCFLLFFNGCASTEIYVITPQDCFDACDKAGSDYVGIIYANIGYQKTHPTLEGALAGCLCRYREKK